jgi:lactoylglutathione lyase
MEFQHVCLNVADAEESVAFYEQLGFTETWSFETADGETVNRYVADENGMELQLSDTEGESSFEQGTAWDHIALGVEDVDATVENIDHYGVVKEPEPQYVADAYIAFIKDPDGHVIELVEPLEE